jgi:predicted hotdog family 3-hydroxylacyl-ACP dehydratase
MHAGAIIDPLDVAHIPVGELLLQRHEMLLIDRVLAAGATWVEASVRLPAGHPLLDARGLPAWVGIELMAQAVSAFSALELRARGEPPRIGLLLGTRRFEARVPFFPLDIPLRVRAALALRDDTGLGVFDCSIDAAGAMLAEAQIKGQMPADIDAFLEAMDG